MQRYSEWFAQIRADIDATCPTGAGRIEVLIDQYRQALGGGTTLCLCVSFSTSRGSLTSEVIDQISQFRTLMLTWIEATVQLGKKDGTIASVGDPAMEAASILPLLEGAQLTARAQETPILFDNAVALLASRLLH